jgi:hypothetical protein
MLEDENAQKVVEEGTEAKARHAKLCKCSSLW